MGERFRRGRGHGFRSGMTGGVSGPRVSECERVAGWAGSMRVWVVFLRVGWMDWSGWAGFGPVGSGLFFFSFSFSVFCFLFDFVSF